MVVVYEIEALRHRRGGGCSKKRGCEREGQVASRCADGERGTAYRAGWCDARRPGEY